MNGLKQLQHISTSDFRPKILISISLFTNMIWITRLNRNMIKTMSYRLLQIKTNYHNLFAIVNSDC